MTDLTTGGFAPAERYAASRAPMAASRVGADSDLARFRAAADFELDDFQVVACQALADGHGVLVAAPTGAGKTVVGEFAVQLALSQRGKAFYTTPIKALSNQKYHDLVARHGASQVGLLTGDVSLNGEAPVVVMTTEVLRNMLYAGSSTLTGLRFVVMDEVHYLADRFRGPVWEEVIIQLPRQVQVVSLSATVSNAEEFGDWLQLVRGDTSVVVSEHRPVPLWQQVCVSSAEPRGRPRLLDLYSSLLGDADGRRGRLNPEVVQALRAPQGREPRAVSERRRDRRRHPNRAERPTSHAQAGDPHRRRRRTPPRFAVVDALDRDALLPAIYFVFSRAGCDGAVGQLMRAGLRLTNVQEEAQIRDLIAERTATMAPEDLEVLGFWAWQQALAHGIAAHHAGLLPVFKETVEELFVRGLVKVVFATETLALGINMPARSVVLEKLDKWNGLSHEPLTAGEYTQLTGRAGRRGIDVEGHAVVVDHPGLDPTALAALASRRTYPLQSSFRPTYNMAVNLVATVGASRAREVLETSFAQFQADRGVVGLAREIQGIDEALSGYRNAMVCERGDFLEYAALRARISDAERKTARARKQKRATAEMAERLAQLRESLRKHPCHKCPDREDHARWAERSRHLWRERDRLVQRIQTHTGSVARTFDKTCRVLVELGYLAPDGPGGSQLRVTEDGQWLRRLYAENDLLLAECLRRGVWDRLDAPALAAAVSTVIYSGRGQSPAPPPLPGGPQGTLAQALLATEQVWSQLTDLEASANLEATGEIDLGLVSPLYRWATGRGLAAVLRGSELAAGDFVRWCKQVIDVLDQLSSAAPTEALCRTARRAKTAVLRGVVAQTSFELFD